jgi:hypothetical protein
MGNDLGKHPITCWLIQHRFEGSSVPVGSRVIPAVTDGRTGQLCEFDLEFYTHIGVYAEGTMPSGAEIKFTQDRCREHFDAREARLAGHR